MSQVQIAPVVIEMPQTAEQLRHFVAGTMNELLNIPENKAVQAESLLTYLLGLVKEKQASENRANLRPVVVSTYYRGSARATIGLDLQSNTFLVAFDQEAKDADGKIITEAFELNGVQLTRPTWTKFELPGAAYDMMSKLVLSQPVQPGQVFFVTTGAAIEAHMEALTDVFAKQDELREKLDNAGPEELLATEEAQALASAQ